MVNPFERVIVDYLVAGQARITWNIARRFIARTPFTYQLQGSHAAQASEADDWFDIGDPREDVCQLFDPDKRLYGKTPTLTYRIKLTDADGNNHYSAPAGVLGRYTARDFSIASEIVRKEVLRHTTFASVPGFLLKARRYGEACSCVDAFTGEVRDSDCEICYGTGVELGYFPPEPRSFVDLTSLPDREARDMTRGTERKALYKGRMIAVPQLVQGDAWANGQSDERYYVHQVTESASWKSVPLVYDVELRLAPYSDVVYTVPLPEDYDE